MAIDIISRLGNVLGKSISDQSILRENIRPEDPNALIQVGARERIIVTGTLVINKGTLGTDSFVIDHPVYGELDSSVFKLDGGYSSIVTVETILL